MGQAPNTSLFYGKLEGSLIRREAKDAFTKVHMEASLEALKKMRKSLFKHKLNFLNAALGGSNFFGKTNEHQLQSTSSPS